MKTVLVIEDNILLRENTAELLELAGYHVLTSSNGHLGFKNAFDNKPHIVLCDIVMKDSGGETFLRLAKEEISTRNIPIIFFSAGSAPLSVSKGIERGGDIYLQKPFTNEELLDAVEKCFVIKAKRKAGDNF